MTNQDTPTLWADMTPEQKGARLLAKDREAYRVNPEPKRETVTMSGYNVGYWYFGSECLIDRDTHQITFDTINGEPDCTTIRMDRLT